MEQVVLEKLTSSLKAKGILTHVLNFMPGSLLQRESMSGKRLLAHAKSSHSMDHLAKVADPTANDS
jgi:hypothetical protein